MDENKDKDPRYAPPYPQNFHPFWPRHALKASLVVSVVVLLIVGLAYFYGLPSDYTMTIPDEGMYIPGPEWYYLFFFQPFWYLKGGLAKWQFIATFIIPLLVLTFTVLIPFIFKKLKPVSGFGLKVIRILPPAIVFAAIMLGIVFSGYHAKLNGCIACHNIQAGVRHDLPPMNVLEYYKGHKQVQIKVGKYRASKSGTEGESVIGQEIETYKDANWHMRHLYEPTFTW
ncbi:MAG: hypothetical protein HZC45_04290 [Deltaproteobacteria bacterium]|nr:hypothetical protein [Deltaproteobacteria bacterium]